MRAYYNDHDSRVAQWLRGLISKGLIMDGEVDTRSIVDVRAKDLAGFVRCHFFAGIGGWEVALALSNWPRDRPVWTGSCPCQPFSNAGRKQGQNDARHLWPEFYRLITECRPATVFGEQVASPLGRAWLAAIRADLEDVGYGVGAADLCAAGVGAPHIRQRLYWVADAQSLGERRDNRELETTQRNRVSEIPWQGIGFDAAGNGRPIDGLADATGERHDRWWTSQTLSWKSQSQRSCAVSRLADADSDGCDQGRPSLTATRHDGVAGNGGDVGGLGNANNRSSSAPWADLEWLACADGKSRPTKPGLFPLAHGVPGRVGLLRGAGNAIVPKVAAEFINASMEAQEALSRRYHGLLALKKGSVDLDDYVDAYL